MIILLYQKLIIDIIRIIDTVLSELSILCRNWITLHLLYFTLHYIYFTLLYIYCTLLYIYFTLQETVYYIIFSYVAGVVFIYNSIICEPCCLYYFFVCVAVNWLNLSSRITSCHATCFLQHLSIKCRLN